MTLGELRELEDLYKHTRAVYVELIEHLEDEEVAESLPSDAASADTVPLDIVQDILSDLRATHDKLTQALVDLSNYEVVPGARREV